MSRQYLIKYVLFMFFCSAIFFGCGNSQDKTSGNGSLTPQQNENKSELFSISDKTAGIFRIGNPVPATNDFQFITEDKIENREGDNYKYKISKVYSGDKLALELRLSDANTIDEMFIYSDKFTTKEGYGIGSYLMKILTNEQDYELFYTYVSDRFVLFKKQLPEIQFFIDPNSFKGDRKKLTSSDMVLLKLQEFNEDSKIIQTRIY